MKTFQQFINEAYDPDIQGRSQITKSGEGGRIGRKRKQTDAEKKRVRAVGGGKTVPAKTYKDKADIGKTNKKRSPAGRQQQPTKERGSAGLSPREQQKKARAERLAAKSGAKTKTADELLTKKTKTVSPKYQSTGKPGHTGTSKREYSRAERQKLRRSSDRLLSDIKKNKEKPASHYDPQIT